MEAETIQFEKYIRNIPDFPKKGIQFKDITTLIREGDIFAAAIDFMYDPFRQREVTRVVGIEARGFIFASALAYKLNVGTIPIRKSGKLPGEIISEEYELEYGTDSVEMHKDAIGKEDKVLIVDDLLATGGTAAATMRLVEKSGAQIVGFSFLIELTELQGREKLGNNEVHSLIFYDI
jgi:adenine phosphoribosyltransferase